MDCRGKNPGADFPQDAVQALDVALKHGTSLNAATEAVGRAFFLRNERSHPIGRGAEVGDLRLYLETSCSVGVDKITGVNKSGNCAAGWLLRASACDASLRVEACKSMYTQQTECEQIYPCHVSSLQLTEMLLHLCLSCCIHHSACVRR